MCVVHWSDVVRNNNINNICKEYLNFRRNRLPAMKCYFIHGPQDRDERKEKEMSLATVTRAAGWSPCQANIIIPAIETC